MNGSTPQYASLALDENGDTVMFVLLDGNAAAGYTRAYLWMPKHARYGQPVPVSRGANETFPSLTWPVDGDAPVETTWRIRAWIEEQAAQAGGERTVSHHDYATGRTVTRTQVIAPSEARRLPRFDFSVRYRHAGGYASRLSNASDALDIDIDGQLPVAAKWEARPSPFAPWNQLYVQSTLAMRRDPDTPDKGDLLFQMRLVYHPHQRRPCRVASLPRDAVVELDIIPYLEEPLLSESVPAAQMFAEGFAVPVAFGWYQYKVGVECEGLTVHPFLAPLFPFARQ